MAAYILQQRCTPFVAVSAISGHLGLTTDSVSQQLKAISDRKQSIGGATLSNGLHSSSADNRAPRKRSTPAKRLVSPPISSSVDGVVSAEGNLETDAGAADTTSRTPSSRSSHDSESKQPPVVDVGAVTVWTTDVLKLGSAPLAEPSSCDTKIVELTARGSQHHRCRDIAVSCVRAVAAASGSSVSALLRRLLVSVKTAVYTGVINYNHLETAFLMAAIVILILGMVFTSQGFPAGSVGYDILTAIAIIIITTSSGVFASLLVFEVYRSLKFSALNDMARQLEVDMVEQAMAQSRRRDSANGGAKGRKGTGRRQPDRGPSRRSSIVDGLGAIRRRFSRSHADGFISGAGEVTSAIIVLH